MKRLTKSRVNLLQRSQLGFSDKCLNDVVAALDQEKTRLRECDFYSYPVMVLAYSFALARMRRNSDARNEFKHVLESKFYEGDVLPGLQELFESEIRGSKNGFLVL